MAMNKEERDLMKNLVAAILFRKSLAGRPSEKAPSEEESRSCQQFEGIVLMRARQMLGV